MKQVTDVLVVGAGPTGLTLATQLLRLGVRTTIIDKSAGPSTTSKAIGLQYRVSELLAWMGLAERFIARAAEQTTVNLIADGKPVARLVLDVLEGAAGRGAFTPRPIILPQSDTEALLADALRGAGGAVEWGRELVGLSQEQAGVVATLADHSTVEARYLVSCEGAHSFARKACNIPFEGSTFPHDFIMADVAMKTHLQTGQAYSWLHSRGTLNAIPMPGVDRWRLFIEVGDAVVGEVTLDAVRALYAERAGDPSSRIEDPTWLTRFRIHSRMVGRFRAGSVFLAGDAAHLHSPSGGQGITTGMQDAYNLAWKLAHVLRHGAPVALLDTYDSERRPAARAVLAATDRNTRLLFPTSRLGKWFRNSVFMPLLRRKWVQARLVAKLSQLGVSYRGSRLARDVGIAKRVRAGARTPDVLFSGAAWEGAGPGSLFRLLAEGRFVALLVDEERETPPLAVTLRALGLVVRGVRPTGDFEALYGARTGEVLLVRPDGYLGYRGPSSRQAALRAYLELAFSARAVENAFEDRGTRRIVAAARAS